MKKIFTLAAFLFMLQSCRKDSNLDPGKPVSDMEYTNFNNKEVGFNHSHIVDLNRDNFNDFSVYSILVGDPLSQTDYHQYYFGSAYFTDFPINNREETALLNKGDNIAAGAFPDYNWYNASDIVMAQKVVGMNDTHWEGLWKNAAHKYLPLRITVQNQFYYGWAEVSFDTLSEGVILHHAAICREAGRAIKAGE